MLEEFNIAEKGNGPYWMLAILRWVMVLIFISFGIQKFTPQSAEGIAVYISNSPFVSWLHIFGIRGEAYLLGTVELVTAGLLVLGAFVPVLSALGSLMVIVTFAITWSFFFDPRCRQMEHIHGPDSMESSRRVFVQGHRPALCLCCPVFGIPSKEIRSPSVELISGS
jgi:uncharacterized membrane protein YkgB